MRLAAKSSWRPHGTFVALRFRSTARFERTAFKVKRIYATLAAHGFTANSMFTPDEHALKCTVAPEAFSPVGRARRDHGETCCTDRRGVA
jgi:hypothetical protein